MTKYDIQLRFVTPCLMAGADQNNAELRASSIRGALRFWFRVLGGSLSEEQEIFGGCAKDDSENVSAKASKVIVRIEKTLEPAQTEKLQLGRQPDYFLWPFTTKSRQWIKAATIAKIAIFDKSDSAQFEACLKAFLFLGSLGGRSRRAYGSIMPESVACNGIEWTLPKTLEDFTKIAAPLIRNASVSMIALSTQNSALDAITLCKEYLQTFRCGKQIYNNPPPLKWGESDHDLTLPAGQNNHTIYRAAIALPQNTKYYNCTLKGAERWASPICLKVLQLGNSFIPAVIILKNYLLPENTTITLVSTKSPHFPLKDVTVSHDLIRAMTDCNELKTQGFANAKVLF